MLETEVIKSLLNNNNYKKYRNYLNTEDFSKETQKLVNTVDDWFTENTEDLSVSDLSNLVFSQGVNEKLKDYYSELFINLDKPITSTNNRTMFELLEHFKRTKLYQSLSAAAYERSRGYGSDIEVQSIVEQLKTPIKEADIKFVSKNIFDLIKNVREPGLRWRLQTMNSMLGSLRKGDFGFIFARPETGKTTFLASEMTYMASQIKDGSGPVLWFNNEEVGEKVQMRCYQAALNCDITTVLRDPEKAQERFIKATNGNLEIFDEACIDKRVVEKICEKLSPSLIVFDQIDKIKGFKADRDDMMLGAIYQWARELAKTYAPVIGICQASVDAEGVQWLHMNHVASAKTSKQAEADWILGIGRKLDAGYENLRYLHLSKNKLAGDNDSDSNQRHGRREVLIKASHGRYEDI